MHRRALSSVPFFTRTVFLLAIAAAAHGGTVDTSRYQTPAQAIVDMVDAPQVPQTIFSPLNDWILLLDRPALPSVVDLAQPELRLAGLRINPRLNDESRQLHATGLRLLRVSDRAEKSIQGLPGSARIVEASWAPDAKKIALTIARENNLEVWIVDVTNGLNAKRLVDRSVNGLVSGRPMVWAADSKSVFVSLLPQNRTPPRGKDSTISPIVQENLGRRNAARTYQDLLKNAHDEALLEHYLTSELARISLDGKLTVLAAGMLRSFSPSPDGEYVLVQTVRKPFSYTVPITRFPLRTEVRDALDANVGSVVKLLSDIPLAEDEELDPDAVRKGPRSYMWRADAQATVVWAQSSDPKKVLGDYLFSLAAPFDGEPHLMMKVETRFQGVQWANDAVALVTEGSRKQRRSATWRVFPGEHGRAPVKLWERSTEDRYADPGTPQTEQNSRGARVLNLSPDGRAIYLIGAGASPEGERPFIDRFDLETKEARRLYRSPDARFYDLPLAIFDRGQGAPKLVLQRESPSEAPNLFLRDLGNGQMVQMTRFSTPKNPIATAKKEIIKYQRRDGVDLTATLYTPGNFKKGDDPLPLIMWAYPREFRSADAAGQVTGSPFRYVRPAFSGPLPFLTQGYAVLDNPSMPIIGEAGKENDTYLPQLISGAEAAIDEVVRRGVADRNRIAVGGHSYGAFMVANLLAHTKLFAAGIAESGAYNRTLTPFGFQAEERTYWRAREVYQQMSPFNFADQLKTPILLIHGEADSNTGTFPLQSERMYQAIRGHGGTARLVMLPFEDHGYRGRESVLHRLWESTRWLDRYVKNVEKR